MFVHLHNHTDYSFRDSIAKIKKTLERVKELGMTAYAITDHGHNMGWYKFSKYAKEIGVKPIFGVEMYEVNDVEEKVKKGEEKYHHIVFLAKNKEGIKALNKMITYAHTKFYYNPRIDMNYIKTHAKELFDNVIVLTGCINGRLPQLLLEDKEEEATQYVFDLISYLGVHNVFIELQNHGKPEEIEATKRLILFADKYKLKTVATNDVHYIYKEDYILREIMLARDRKQTLQQREQNGEIFPPELYIKTEQEMLQVLPETAVFNTSIINNMIEEIDLEEKIWHFPQIEKQESIEEICKKEIPKKYKGKEKEIEKIVEEELKVIDTVGAQDYLLLCRDFIQYAKNNDIMVGLGRGSAVGSVVCYLLGITDVEPLRYNLFFERFMNPERITMPDIDTDFEKSNRDTVIRYAINKYGADRVAHIANVTTLGFKQAFKDVAAVYGLTPEQANNITTKIESSDEEEIRQEIENKPELKKQYEQYKDIFEKAFVLTGTIRQKSVHASGIIISDAPITNYMALDYNTEDGVPIILGDMADVEYLKLIKMDFLALKTLNVIKDTLKLIKERHGIDIDIKQIPLDDKNVWQYIGSGNTDMIFQLEEEGMQNFMKQLKPKCIEDLIAGISLYRPGPMDMIPSFIQNKEDPSKIQYPKDAEHLLKPILDVTYGIIVYQEQVMQIFRDLAGYSLGEADLVRRAMAKKKKMELQQHYDKFIQGCTNNSISQDTAQMLWDRMESFSEYAFNKSHATAYAIMGYITAYLKYYYKTEYITAYLNHLEDNQDISDYVKSAEQEGIKIIAPDVNKAEAHFTITNENEIMFGLKHIKGVKKEVEVILQNRPFTDFDDFIKRTKVNKSVAKSLCLVGALDSIISNRKYIIDHIDLIYKNQKLKKPKPQPLPPLTDDYIDYSDFEKFWFEYTILGTNLTKIEQYEYRGGGDGYIGFIQCDKKNTIKTSKSGKHYYAFELIDFDKKSRKILCFKEEYFDLIKNGTLVRITGQQKDEVVFVDTIEPLTEKDFRKKQMFLIIDCDEVERRYDLQQLKQFLLKHKDTNGTILYIKYHNTLTTFRINGSYIPYLQKAYSDCIRIRKK